MKSKIIICSAFAASLFSFNTQAANVKTISGLADTAVLKSSSGLCHLPTSGYRDRIKILNDKSNVFTATGDTTKNYDFCLKSGGRALQSTKEELKKEAPEIAQEIEEQEQANSFYGLNWGAGLALTHISEDIIEDISIENSKVSVNHSVNHRAIAMLESHYFFQADGIAHGPFVAIGIAGDDKTLNPLSTYGAGWMLGFRQSVKDRPWNLGLGVFIDSSATHLRSGVKDGEVTTETDPSKLTKEEDSTGVMLMLSSQF
jgi:hypothetical protein